MKRIFSAFLILLSGCVSRLVEPPAGHIVLAAEHSLGSWVPSEADIAVLKSDLALLFANPDGRFEGDPNTRLSEYLMRYYGDIREGERVIIGEGTHVSQVDFTTFKETNSKPDTVVLSPFGGGRMYFTAVYDPTMKKITSVRLNAPL